MHAHTHTHARACTHTHARTRTHTHQCTFGAGNHPPDWLKTTVYCGCTEIDHHLLENDMHISLTSAPSRLLKHIDCYHLLQHSETRRVSSDLNHHFCSGNFCETQLSTNYDLSFNKRRQASTVMLNLAKAFNAVPNHKLLHKLRHYGVDSLLQGWVTS